MDFDTEVKLYIHNTIARTTQAPTAHQIAKALSVGLEDVSAAFTRLHEKRLLVPDPADPARIRMASPFSGVETPFRVSVQEKEFYANCAWDAYGVSAALHQDAIIHAWDDYSGEPIQLEIRDGQPVLQPCVAHFAVPAAKWWEDILYT